MEPTNPTPVAVSFNLAIGPDGEPAEVFGQPVFQVRSTHLDTGTSIVVSIPAGSSEAIEASYALGAAVPELVETAVRHINGQAQ